MAKTRRSRQRHSGGNANTPGVNELSETTINVAPVLSNNEKQKLLNNVPILYAQRAQNTQHTKPYNKGQITRKILPSSQQNIIEKQKEANTIVAAARRGIRSSSPTPSIVSPQLPSSESVQYIKNPNHRKLLQSLPGSRRLSISSQSGGKKTRRQRKQRKQRK